MDCSPARRVGTAIANFRPFTEYLLLCAALHFVRALAKSDASVLGLNQDAL